MLQLLRIRDWMGWCDINTRYLNKQYIRQSTDSKSQDCRE